MIHVHSPDTYEFPDIFAPWLQGVILGELFPHLSTTAAEDMEGELPAGVISRNGRGWQGNGKPAGPAYSQLFLDEVDE